MKHNLSAPKKYVAALFVGLFCAQAHAQVSLAPGSLIAATYGSQSQTAKLMQFDATTGTQMGQVNLRTVTNQSIDQFFSMTRIGGQLICSYLSGMTEGGLGYIDPASGIVTNIPDAPFAPYGLGNRDGRLLFGDYDYIQEYDLATHTITLQTNLQDSTGLDDSYRDVTWYDSYYVVPFDGVSAGSTSNNLTFWSPGTGQFQGNPLIQGEPTRPNGIDYDPTTGRFWIASYLAGTTTSRLSAYPVSGFSQVPQVSFTVNNALLADVLYIPVPAPSVLTLFGAATIIAARRRRDR